MKKNTKWNPALWYILIGANSAQKTELREKLINEALQHNIMLVIPTKLLVACSNRVIEVY